MLQNILKTTKHLKSVIFQLLQIFDGQPQTRSVYIYIYIYIIIIDKFAIKTVRFKTIEEGQKNLT